MGSFPSANNRGPYGDTVRFHAPEDIVHNLLNSSPRHLFTAGWTVGLSDSRPEKTKIVLDFGDRGHGRTRIVTALLLIDGNRWRKAFDGITVCFLHLSNKLTGIRREALYIPSLTFGVKRVKGKAGFA